GFLHARLAARANTLYAGAIGALHTAFARGNGGHCTRVRRSELSQVGSHCRYDLLAPEPPPRLRLFLCTPVSGTYLSDSWVCRLGAHTRCAGHGWPFSG